MRSPPRGPQGRREHVVTPHLQRPSLFNYFFPFSTLLLILMYLNESVTKSYKEMCVCIVGEAEDVQLPGCESGIRDGQLALLILSNSRVIAEYELSV